MVDMTERCPTCKRKLRRSNEANRRYWMIIHLIADKVKPAGAEYSPETWHSYFKLRLLGGDDVKLPNGKTLVLPKSSAELDTHEFHEYAEKVEAWAAERDVFLDELPT